MALGDLVLWPSRAWRSKCGPRSSSSSGCSFSASSKMNRLWWQRCCTCLIWSVSSSCTGHREPVGPGVLSTSSHKGLEKAPVPPGICSALPDTQPIPWNKPGAWACAPWITGFSHDSPAPPALAGPVGVEGKTLPLGTGPASSMRYPSPGLSSLLELITSSLSLETELDASVGVTGRTGSPCSLPGAGHSLAQAGLKSQCTKLAEGPVGPSWPMAWGSCDGLQK